MENLDLKDQFKITILGNKVVEIEYVLSKEEEKEDRDGAEYFSYTVYNSDNITDTNVKTVENEEPEYLFNLTVEKLCDVIKDMLVKYVNTGCKSYFNHMFEDNKGNCLTYIFKNENKFTFYNAQSENLMNFIHDLNNCDGIYIQALSTNYSE